MPESVGDMQKGLFCHEIGLFCHGGMASNDAFSYGASADAYQGQSCNHAYEAIMPSPHQGMLHHALAGDSCSVIVAGNSCSVKVTAVVRVHIVDRYFHHVSANVVILLYYINSL